MPVRLIGTLIVAAIAALFTGYNLGNTCDVWVFHTFKDVPVAFTIIISLLAGVLIMVPFTIGKNAPRKPTEKDMALLAKAEKKEAREKLKKEKQEAKLLKKSAKAEKKAVKEEKSVSDASLADAEVVASEPDDAAVSTTVEYTDGNQL